MRLSYHPAVQDEVAEICAWYDARRDLLGDEFFAELERVLGVIIGNPEFFPPHAHGRRKAPLKRFPYGIYYRVLADRVRILAICHHKRHPDYGVRRR